MHFKKATPTERAAYKAAGGVYPLHGTAQSRDGITCYIEDLREWGRGNPTWEVAYPKGYIHALDMTHTSLCYSLAEAKETVRYAPLMKCDCIECMEHNS